MLKKTSTIINKFALSVCMLLLTVMVLVIWFQVISRYVFSACPPWTEEVSRCLMVWLAMIGASIMVWEQKNVSVDFIVAKFNPKVQKVLSIILKLVTVVVFILMIIQGWEYVQSGLKSISPATGINKGVIYLAIPVGGALMLFQTISLIILEIKEK